MAKSATAAVNTTTALFTLPVGNVQMPVFLLRLDNSADLSFACMLRVDLCGEKKTEFEMLDYLNILNSQKNIFIEEGLHAGQIPLTNQESGRPLMKMKRTDGPTVSELFGWHICEALGRPANQ
jgi:hypothetical protein